MQEKREPSDILDSAMNTSMDDSRLLNVTQLQEFLTSSQEVSIRLDSIEEKYHFIDRTVDRFSYKKLSRGDKHLVYVYLRKLTGYKKAQLLRLIKRAVIGKLVRTEYRRKNPNRIYTSSDIKLLEKTDELHLRLNAMATHEILRREKDVFGHTEYGQIAQCSVSHINNLRHHPVYVNSWVNGTKARNIGIGSTKPPEPNNLPGAIRIDTVHQRDVFHINAVDEITQWEVVVCVPVIAESCLAPALRFLLDQFPFIVFNFHSDRGCEFINYTVETILNNLLIKQTKSRSRHCNDNALVESKNASVVRKNMGYCHINQGMADTINTYYHDFLNPYLNFHRPCLYLTETSKDDQGRERRVYGDVMVPYDKLKRIAKTTQKQFLKPVTSWEKLNTIAYAHSDNEWAIIVRNEERKLFNKVFFTKNP